MKITQATLADIDSVAAAPCALAEEPLDELFDGARGLIEDQNASAAVFLAFADGQAVAIGFAEVVLRATM